MATWNSHVIIIIPVGDFEIMLISLEIYKNLYFDLLKKPPAFPVRKRRLIILCGRRDSNPHASRHQILSLARLPITPRPLFSSCKYTIIFNSDYRTILKENGLKRLLSLKCLKCYNAVKNQITRVFPHFHIFTFLPHRFPLLRFSVSLFSITHHR